MNAKKCKKLRDAARKMTIGKPWAVYVRRPNTGEIRLMPTSGKGIYRRMKREAV